MSQKPAYTNAEIIATGLALEASGPVTATALHTALGGRGTRAYVAGIWDDFEEERSCRRPNVVPGASDEIAPEVARDIAAIADLAAGIARKSAAAVAETSELRAGHFQQQVDALLAERNRLKLENESLLQAGRAHEEKLDRQERLMGEMRGEIADLRLQIATSGIETRNVSANRPDRFFLPSRR